MAAKPSRSGPAPSQHQDFFPDPAVDRLTATILRLAEELWVVTERLAAFEALALRRGVPAAELIGFQFTPAEDEAVRADRARFIRRILEPLSHTDTANKA
jgi:hypothetical protein